MRTPQVLVAEDDRVVSLLLCRTLENLGWRITATYDGEEALRLGLETPFDLVFLDLMLPGILGEEVLQRWSLAGRQAPVIVVSSLTTDQHVLQCLELGAVDFIRKPFSVPELVARAKLHLPAGDEIC